MTLGDVIRDYRRQHGISQREFARLCGEGISNSYVSMLENNRNPKTGKPIEPSFRAYFIVARVLGISVNELARMLDPNSMISSATIAEQISEIETELSYGLPTNITKPQDLLTHKVRLVSRIAAGEPLPTEDEWEVVDAPSKADYALTVYGDSMSPDYLEGDIVYIRAQDDVCDGTVAAVLIDNEATLKRVYKVMNGVQLISINPRYAPMIFTIPGVDAIRILGVPVGYTRMFR